MIFACDPDKICVQLQHYSTTYFCFVHFAQPQLTHESSIIVNDLPIIKLVVGELVGGTRREEIVHDHAV